MHILLWPNLVGSDEAPTTAKYGCVKNARAAASVAIFIGRYLRSNGFEIVSDVGV